MEDAKTAIRFSSGHRSPMQRMSYSTRCVSPVQLQMSVRHHSNLNVPGWTASSHQCCQDGRWCTIA